MKISVVLPFYNTRDYTAELYQRLARSLNAEGVDWEMICVDDCSPQKDWEVISLIGEQDTRVKLIRFVRNFGQQTAISAGLAVSQGDWVVVMDADLQDRPEEIPRLLAKALEGYQIVYARRVVRKVSPLKKIYSKVFHIIFEFLTGIKMDDTVGNFGIYGRQTVDTFLSMKERFRGFGLLISWIGQPSASIQVEQQKREGGKSSYTFRKGLSLAVDAFIAFSDKPLKILAISGFALSLLAFGVGIAFLIRGLLGYTEIVGWTSLIISIWFLSGVTIFIIGVLGLYLGKVFDEVKGRPHYIVDMTLNLDTGNDPKRGEKQETGQIPGLMQDPATKEFLP